MNIASRLAVYDPRELPETDFLQSFIARQDTLERQLRHVRNNNNATLTRHSLVIGQRGMGKTSLLRRLALAIRDDAELNQQWIPLNFREEQYNVAQLSQLWANCADALADWCQQQGDDESADQLDDSQSTPDKLWPIIQSVSEKHQRRLVLLIDNLNLILDNLSDDDQWGLREVLQHRDGPMLLACSSVMPAQLAHRESAFYEFVSYEKLCGLSVAEMRGCLHKLASIRGSVGQQVIVQLRQQPQRIDVLHNLCGGNPRTLTVIYQVLEGLAVDVDQSSSQLLEAVLENTTPLYKARTEELSQQQRRVFDAIALNWDPIHSSDIAKTTALPGGGVSPQLKRLEHDGLIEKVSLGGKRKGYQLVERFYNIWYLMRHGSRRSRERLRWLTQFLTLYYDKSELEQRARLMVQGGVERNSVSEALFQAMDDSPVREALHRRISLNLPAELLNVKESEQDYSRVVLSHAARRTKVIEALNSNEAVQVDAEYFANLLSRSSSLTAAEKDHAAQSIANLSQQKINALADVLQDEYKQSFSFFGDDFKLIADAFQQGLLEGRHDIEGALALLITTDNPGLQYVILSLFTDLVKVSGFSSSSLAPFPATFGHKDANIVGIVADLLAGPLNRYEEAEQAYRRAIEIDGESAYAWNALGNLQLDCLGQPEEAHVSWQKAIELDPADTRSPSANIVWAELFAGKAELAESALQKLTLPEPGIALLQAGLLVSRGNPGGATELLKEPLSSPQPKFWSMYQDDLLRLTRLFKRCGFDQFYLDWLVEQRLHIKVAPYMAAVRAFYLDETQLQLVSPEVRQVATPMLQWLKRTHIVWASK